MQKQESKHYKVGFHGRPNKKDTQKLKQRKKQSMKVWKVKVCFILSLIWFNVGGQPLHTQNPHLDSIAKANVKKILYSSGSGRILIIQPTERFKLTFSAQVNNNPFSTNMTLSDWLCIGAYDVRARFYITPTLKVFQRVFITGFEKTNFFFTTGFVKKF